jgi:uncharacterized membrane protein YphA (DoxX/SURF4 family)
MILRTGARVLIAIWFLLSGLVDTLGATGLVLELSPDGRWGPHVHTLAVSGPLQIAGAALLLSGRRTRWAVGVLGCYVSLVSLLGNLPQLFHPDVRGSAVTGLISNMAVIGLILYWLHVEGTAGRSALPGAERDYLGANARIDRFGGAGIL